jgi:hypothetical protein
LSEWFQEANNAAFHYADDLVILGDDDELLRAIGILERWATENNMIINKAKSGILPITGSRFSREREVSNYPVVQEYKYLGLMLNGRLDLQEHCKLINKKAAYLSCRLHKLRFKDDTRINMNLFRVFLMPSYRMAYTAYDRLSERDKEKLKVHMRVWIKKFIRVPINTANHTLEIITGDI